mgnify:FL=1
MSAQLGFNFPGVGRRADTLQNVDEGVTSSHCQLQDRATLLRIWLKGAPRNGVAAPLTDNDLLRRPFSIVYS